MRGAIKYIAVFILLTLNASAVSFESVWEKATSLYGSNADRYLYLALPLKADGKTVLSPLAKDGVSYYVKSAEYKVYVREGKEEKGYRVAFGIVKRGVVLRGVKNGVVVDFGEKELYDIFYRVKEGEKVVEYHNYFNSLPTNRSLRLFPGFFGSNYFGRLGMKDRDKYPEYVGCYVKSGENEFIWIDPSSYTKMGAKPYESGEKSLLSEKSLLDYASAHWELISELRIWNIFHYGIEKPKERRLTGFLKIDFYVKPVAEPYKFGNITLPFSNVWYEVDYKLSSETAKAALFASNYSLVPQRSFFRFKKSASSGKIDFEIDISIDDIEFQKMDKL